MLSILSLSGSLPVNSCTIRLTAIYYLTVRLTACLVINYQAHILSLSGLLHVYSYSQACCLSSLSLSLRLAACLFSTSGLLPTYSHHLAYCLSILSLSLAAYLFSCAHSSSLPVYSHTSRLTAYTYSYTIRLTAIHSHSIRLTAYVFRHYQARCHLFSQYQTHSPSILTLMLLSICPHTQCH